MSRNLLALVLTLLLLFTGACVPQPAGVSPAPAPKVVPSPPSPAPPPSPRVSWGTIEIRVTDPPPADVKSAVVYLTNIEVHRVSDNTGEWITVINTPASFDLLGIIGIEKILGSANITAGRFTQIRMDVDKVEVITTAGENVTAEVPSEKLKIVGQFEVEPGQKTILTLDFDGEKSLIVPRRDKATGRTRALFKPVVKLKAEKERPRD